MPDTQVKHQEQAWLPVVSIVVLAYNGVDHLRICLPSVVNQTYPADRLEILVVDNGSSDGSADFVKEHFPTVRLVRNPQNYGFARGNTIGARAAIGEYVAFLNQDTRADRDWVAELMAPIRAARQAGDPTLVCTAAKMLSWDGSVIDFAGGRMNFIGKASQVGSGQPDAEVYDVPRETLFACGGAMLIDRSVYLDVGGFDDDYFVLFEDVDLGWRLWVLGWRVQMAPKAVVYHRLHASVGEVHDVRKQLIFERNAMFTILKNYDDANLGRALPAALLLTLHRVLGELRESGVRADEFNIRNRHHPLAELLPMSAPAAGLLLAIDEVLHLMPSLMAKRQAIQARRRRPDSDIVRLFGGPLEPLELEPGFADTSYILTSALGVDHIFADANRHLLIVTSELAWPGTLSVSPHGLRAAMLAQSARAAGHRVTIACHAMALAAGMANAPDELSTTAWTETTIDKVIDDVKPDALLACSWEILFWIDPARRDRRVPLIVDLYEPRMLGRREADLATRAGVTERKVMALSRVDLVTCATDRQRAYFEGWLAQAGRDLGHDTARPVVVPFAMHSHAATLPLPTNQPGFVWWADGSDLEPDGGALMEVVNALDAASTGSLTIIISQADRLDSPHHERSLLIRNLSDSARVTIVSGRNWANGQPEFVDGHVGLDLCRPGIARELAPPTWTCLCLAAGVPLLTDGGNPLATDIKRVAAGWVVDGNEPERVNTLVARILAEPAVRAERAANARRLADEQLDASRAFAPIDRFLRLPTLQPPRAWHGARSAMPSSFAAARPLPPSSHDAVSSLPPRSLGSGAGDVPPSEGVRHRGGQMMSGSTPELLSVVIPTYNRPELLAKVLQGLEAQTWPRERFEVIVIDDGGDMPAAPAVEAAAARGLPAVVEWQANAGPAAARNRGIRRATGSVIVFLDDDCVPTTDWLAQHALGHSRPALVTLGRIEWHPDVTVTPLLRYAGERALFDFERIAVSDDAPFSTFYTANAAVDRQLALDAGLFDESFRKAAWEDTEFAYRLRLAGARFVFRRNAVVLHLRGFDLGGFLARQRVAGFESVRAWSKHPELRTLTGVDVVVGEEVEQRFFESAGRYAWLVGAAEALGPGGPGAAMLDTVSHSVGDEPELEAWRNDYIRERESAINQELARRQATINELFGTTDTLQRRLKRSEADLTEARKEYENLTRAYQSQQAWALDMEARLKLAGASPGVIDKVLGRLRPPG